MKKYYFGLIFIALITLGLAGYTLSLGAANKQDAKTEKKANEVAKELNSYITKQRKIPETLDEIGVKDIPESIRYTKKDTTKYEFCMTYKAASSYGTDISGLMMGAALRETTSKDTTSNYYDDYSSYEPSSLYPSYYHKKGKTCQTIKPYLYSYGNSTSSSTYNYDAGDTSAAAVTTNANDTQRKTDITAIHAQLEAYYAQYSKYPTLANLNDSTWRSTNMKGLDKEALRDPLGYSYALVSAPIKNLYSYSVKSKNGSVCDNVKTDCATYTLTATLEVGGTYSRLNTI